MERQLDLFSEVDDFIKAEALNTTSVLVKYGYDTSQNRYLDELSCIMPLVTARGTNGGYILLNY